MAKQVSAQELYDAVYTEALERARAKGHPLPDEVEVFKVIVKAATNAVAKGDEHEEFLHELSEVKSFHIREKLESQRMEEREKALREGTLLDFDDLLK